jgi:sugar-specific transcriptional regulator TrmB
MANIQHKDVINQLSELGFSDHESEIYLSVLRHGEASAGVVLDDVKLHREQVYRALKRLVDGGLITQFEKRKRAYYSPIDPTVLVNRMKTKMDIAESLQPYLKELHQKKPQIIRVNEGVEAYKIMFDDIIATVPRGGEYLVMSGLGERFYELTKDFYPKYAKALMKKNVTLRLIGYELEDFKQQLQIQELIQVRQIPRAYEVPVATAIYGNKVAIEILDTDNLAIITIENQKVADAYRHTFNTMWELGKDTAIEWSNIPSST